MLPLTANSNLSVSIERIGRHMKGHCGFLTEVFHLKCQNNFPLTCWKSVVEVLLCHLTHNAVPDMWHHWTYSNLQGRLHLVRTCSGPHILQTVSKKELNTLESWAREAIPVCVTYFQESFKSQQLSLFPLCVLAGIRNSCDCPRAAEALVSATQGTNPCMTICNIIKKSVVCFIQPIRANQCKPTEWWESGKREAQGLLRPLPSVLLISVWGPVLCLECCVWIKQIGLHLTL